MLREGFATGYQATKRTWAKVPQISSSVGTTKGLQYSRVSIAAAAGLSGKVSAREFTSQGSATFADSHRSTLG